MNSPEGKAILAKARRGDFAHPGEEEAIQFVAAGAERSGIRRVLDVGCGRGGTAAWFHQHGWGQVVGVDVDQKSIDHARATYPGVEFVALDVGRLADWRTDPFDFICLFNSFYAFPDQLLALGRYYLAPMLDGWVEVFQDPGRRTTGTGAQTYLIAGPGWNGNAPAGVKEYKSPTDMVWGLGRNYCTGTPEGYAEVHAIQDQFRLVPLSSFARTTRRRQER